MQHRIISTTILAVKRDGRVAMAGDGQVTYNNTILKAKTNKIRRLHEDKVVVGFAGSTADAFTLFEKFETKLKEYHGQLVRAAVEMAKEWRLDKILRRLEALLLVADQEHILTLSGNGDVIEPDDDLAAIGSGGPYALSAARALLRNTKLSAKEIVVQSMKIAAEICIYTNEEMHLEELK